VVGSKFRYTESRVWAYRAHQLGRRTAVYVTADLEVFVCSFVCLFFFFLFLFPVVGSRLRWLGRFTWDRFQKRRDVHTSRLQVVHAYIDGVAATLKSELCWLPACHLKLVPKHRDISRCRLSIPTQFLSTIVEVRERIRLRSNCE
jgi:hypothetical protein